MSEVKLFSNSFRRTVGQAVLGASLFCLIAFELNAQEPQCRYLPNLDGVRSLHIQELNAMRRLSNVGRVSQDANLDAIAQKYACQLAATGHFAHTGPDGSKLTDRVIGFGSRYCFVAENLVKGPRTIDSALSAWKSSQSHKKNLEHSAVEKVGIGAAMIKHGGLSAVWVQVFGANC